MLHAPSIKQVTLIASDGFRAVPRVPWNPPSQAPLGWIYYYKESIDDMLKVGHLIWAI